MQSDRSEGTFVPLINCYNGKSAVSLSWTGEKARCCLACFSRSVECSLRGSSLGIYCLHAKLNSTSSGTHTTHCAGYCDYVINVIHLAVVNILLHLYMDGVMLQGSWYVAADPLNSHHGGETHHHIAMLLNKTT